MANKPYNQKQDKQQEGCSPEEVALKSFFLGPQAENGGWLRELVSEVFDIWFDWRKSLFPEDGAAITASDQKTPDFIESRESIRERVKDLMGRLQNEVPSFSPRYIGHMDSEVSMPALLGHIISLLYNPNNISGESSRVGIVIEEEATNALLDMMDFDSREGTGHFTSGGTIANIEGLLRARDRFARWLAVGATDRAFGGQNFNLFQAGLMGWKAFDDLWFRYELAEEDIKKYHILKGNPGQVQRELDRVFDMDYAGPVVLIPNNKHYSWNKAVDILGLGEEAFMGVATDEAGRMDPKDLENKILECQRLNRPPLMVVSVVGTTELGEVDPVHEVQEVLEDFRDNRGWHIWHHVDAAYGGFFCSLNTGEDSTLSKNIKRALKNIHKANSITVDPHKLGYVPYASGAFLCKHNREYFYRKSMAPYINFKGFAERGPQTIEGSRSGAGAISTWLTAKTIGLNPEGYGRILHRTIESREILEEKLKEAHPQIRVFPYAETNILTFCIAREREALSSTNHKTLNVFKAFDAHEQPEFYVSKTSMAKPSYQRLIDNFTSQWDAVHDTKELVLIRLTLMNPFFTSRETINYPETFIEKLKAAINLQA